MAEELIEKYLSDGDQFSAMTGGKVNTVELFAALMNKKDNFADGIRFAQKLWDAGVKTAPVPNPG